jgi:hypothetical protein
MLQWTENDRIGTDDRLRLSRYYELNFGQLLSLNAAMLIDELLIYLFRGQPHLLDQSMRTWLVASRRFADFVTTFRSKIRKKLRVAQDPESLLDLRLELETAYLLLQERRLSLVYEPRQSGQSRCPDFAVTFTTSLTFMVEVTRQRANQKHAAAEASQQTAAAPALSNAPTSPLPGERLSDTICSKLGQLLPQHSNVLIIGVEALHLTESDLHSAMLHTQQRAEGSDTTVWQRHRFRNRADFFRHYQRLSEVLVRESHGPTAGSLLVWVNPQAKHPLPGKVRTALYRSHTV